jgi:SH3-like domain-containing protein
MGPLRIGGIAMHVSRKDGRWFARLSALAILALFALTSHGQSGAAAPDTAAPPAGKSASGLPVPRFVSLKSDRVNLRTGPGTDYPTSWVFRRAGLPVEVLNEFESWRQVRDSEGTTGWVLQSLLSGRRTALVSPWEIKAGNPPPQITVHNDDSESARAVAIVEAGVIANIAKCDGRWCQVSIDKFRGYLQQKQLWGIYPNEILK